MICKLDFEVRQPREETMKIHILQKEPNGEWQVWLDTNVATQDGICLASQTDLDGAIQDARSGLMSACMQLGVPLKTPKAPA